MTKLKLSLIVVIFIIFAVFMGLQVENAGVHSFFTGFSVTLIYGLVVFLFQTLYYMILSKQFILKGRNAAEDYQSPVDIWLLSIPFCVLMAVSFLWFHWYLVQVFFCTTLALTGMLLGDALGRGARRWSIKKSLPFFIGVIASTVFAFLMEWMV
jgi:hypothetical protein